MAAGAQNKLVRLPTNDSIALVFFTTSEAPLRVKLPGNLHPGDLKFSPVWDDLRGDSRFAEIIAAAEKPVKIDNH